MVHSIVKSNDKIEDIIFYISIVSLFLYGLMFPLFDSKIINIILCVLCFAIAFIRKQLSVDIGFILIFITFLLTAVIDLHRGDNSTTVFATLLAFGYMFGKLIVPRDRTLRDERLFVIIFALALGMFLQGMLNYYNGPLYKTPGLTGGWTEFWTGKEDVSRNVFTFDFVYMTSFFSILVLLLKKNKRLAVSILILNVVIELLAFITEGRMNFLLMVVSTAGVLLLYALTNIKSLSKKLMKTASMICLALLVIALAIVLLVASNAFGLYDIYSDSFLNRDGGFLNNIRWSISKEAIKLAFSQPLGGWSVSFWTSLGLQEFGNAHNAWLLFAQQYDTIVFAIMMITKILFIKDAILIAIKKNKTIVDYLLCALFFNVNAYFSMETFPWRYREYWLFLYIISGFIRGRLELEENEVTFPQIKYQRD